MIEFSVYLDAKGLPAYIAVFGVAWEVAPASEDLTLMLIGYVCWH